MKNISAHAHDYPLTCEKRSSGGSYPSIQKLDSFFCVVAVQNMMLR